MQSQTISILYQNEYFDVDYSKLYNSSNKFREIIQPYLDSGADLQKAQIRILYDKFSTRNVRNFLKMLQGQKNDVHSNEIAGICEIAKLFQVDKIYDKSLTYVRNTVDPNFTVPNDFNEENGEKYFEIEFTKDLSQLHSYSTNNIVFDNVTNPINADSSIAISKSQGNLSPNNNNNKDDVPSIYYKIQIFNPVMKCCRYFFSKDGKILYTAKKKSNEIYIGQGNDIHIRSNENENENECCARIMQCNGFNTIYTNEQEFKVTFVPFGVKKQFSIETSFVNDGKNIVWTPREIDVNLSGEHNRTPVPSKKNMLLKNQDGAPTFIVRKMGNEVFEVECLPTVNPLIAFTIGLSQVVGPFTV